MTVEVRTIYRLRFLLVSAYLLGTTHSETVTEIQTIEKTVEVVPDGYIDTNSNEFINNYVDMRQVTDWDASDDGLQLYCEDGSGYWLE